MSGLSVYDSELVGFVSEREEGVVALQTTHWVLKNHILKENQTWQIKDPEFRINLEESRL